MLSPAPQAAPATVLVVDDEPFNVDLLSQELEDLGHAAVPAGDGPDRELFPSEIQGIEIYTASTA